MSTASAMPPRPPQRIRPLAQDVVHKIAAGEIIVAPVHALKELLENAVDAGAKSIEVLVKDGGLKLLQITDDGHGINREDLPILCERFTTSKLKVFEDLTNIGTYGFRGEALASISHIAHLRVTTRTKESSCAWQGYYSAGKLVPAKPGQSADPKACAGRQGTQITVEDLFYNVPTRRKAFRSPSDEYAKILDMVSRYAIHCAGVAFTCKKHGDPSMGVSVQPSANVSDRIRTIHGSGVSTSLINVETSSDIWGFKADGQISNANHHSKKTVFLLFINHRSVDSSVVKKAIEQVYSPFLPKGSHPFVYLSLEIEPQRVDVNVHPTKREVNFLNEDEIVDVICAEIRTKLSKVDTSRTYMTQSLLPGVKIPTISAIGSDTLAGPSLSSADLVAPSSSSARAQNFQTPRHTRPYENNLVRTDSSLRKITSMLPPPTLRSAKSNLAVAQETTTATQPPTAPELVQENSSRYMISERELITCRLTSIKELRARVRDNLHPGLTDIFAEHTFVGIVDECRRIAAIQSRVKLLLVDYGLVLNEYFYQLGLTDFGNFGVIRLDPPLNLRDVLRVGAAYEDMIMGDREEEQEVDWSCVIDAVVVRLIERREMMAEYFSLEISEVGDLLSLPLLVKGYTPSMAKLPRFLLRLGPCVDWSDEQACFHSFLRELASWYVPEALPPPPPTRELKSKESRKGVGSEDHGLAAGTDGTNDDAKDDDSDRADDMDMDNAGGFEGEDSSIVARRAELAHALETVLFPALRARLVVTRGLARGVVEVANLKGLYRVFERC